MNERSPFGFPPAQGLYHSSHEHDACGMGFVVNVRGLKSHSIIEQALQVLVNLAHRGACGCDPETGDGAGILIQIPHQFFKRECSILGFTVPEPGHYGVGMVFLPVNKQVRLQTEGIVETVVTQEGLSVLGWRDTPVDQSAIGRIARGSQPYIEQVFIGRPDGMDEDSFERKLYVVRKRAEAAVGESDLGAEELFYIPSLSCRTIVYKGLMIAHQLARFYPELSDPEVSSALAIVHQRFSTNTFPSWQLAHPYRYVAHNG
jgi:glutamate synthase (NADPH) large chain